MTTNFPTSQDTFSRPTASSALTGHAALHDDLADALEAVEAKVGSDSSAVTSSHDYKIAQLETNKQDSSTALTTSSSFGGDVSGTSSAIAVDQATDTVTGFFKGTRGNKTDCAVNDTGHATIPHNLGTTPTAAFVTTKSQVTTGTGGGEYVISLPVTALDGTNITFRAYEVNVENTNDNSSVSTIFTGSTGSILINVSWMALL